MQKTIKKSGIVLLAFLFAALMAFSATTVHAADFDKTLTVKGIEPGNTVTGYQIVKDKGDGTWEVANSNIKIANPEKPTAAELNKIAGQVKDLGLTTASFTYDATSGDYKATAPAAGSYLVLVTNGADATYVYSPMLVSADYDGSNGTETLNNTTADAKKTKPGVDKVITKKNDETPSNNKGVTLAPGDKVDFKITPTIPNYGTEYTNATYTVADTLTNMTLSGDITVAGKGVEKTDYTVNKGADGKSFTVTFNQAFLTNGNAKNVTITYAATLDSSAARGFGDNPNDVTVTYSNNPNTSDNTKTVDKHTHQYTFDIDGDINGSGSEQTKDIVKVGVDKKTGDVITTTKYGELTTTQTPLSGAQFTLTSKDGKVTKTVTTDKDGLMKITGLDAGDYTLKETKAPAGYKLDTTEVPVKISATLNEDGTLKSYAITINGTQTNTYTATYDGGVKTVAAANANADNKTSLFQNAKSSGLPATGGAGIFFYLIVGGALVALAVVLYTKNRKTQA
jgi:fimbrial isopeptide formation D2 family protein/LPXTG-motif cell wall-anchored protein